MVAILTAIKALFAGALAMATSLVTWIMTATTTGEGATTGRELILVFILVPLIGLGIGVVTRLIHSRD